MTDIYDILKCFSKHLSGHKKEYDIYIVDNRCILSPEVIVFPDNYHKKEVDKESLEMHVFLHHFPDCINSDGDIVNVKDIEDEMVFRYVYSIGKRYRKWIRLR